MMSRRKGSKKQDKIEYPALPSGLKPLTEGQRKLLQALGESSYKIVGVFGPTGTGKSLITLSYGFTQLGSDVFDRIVIAKPVVDVETGRELGMAELGEAYSKLVREYLEDLLLPHIGKELLSDMISQGKIKFSDTHYLRGRTFDNTFVFVDDVQNVPVESMLEIISRIGRYSKLVVAGDPVFQTSQQPVSQILQLRELLLGEEDAAVVDLGLRDIVRPGAQKAVRLLLELKMRKRNLSEDEQRVKSEVSRMAPDADIVTVIDCRPEKRTLNLPSEAKSAPDMLVVVKQGHHGRTVGRGGERVQKVEEITGFSIRVVEAGLDLSQYIKSLHPLPWVVKHILDADIEGNTIVVRIEPGKAGPILGQRGVFIRFVDSVMRKLLGTPVVVREEAT